MYGVLTGFAVIITVILAGYIASRTGIVSEGNRHVLNRTSFYIASPALLFTIVARSEAENMISPVIIVSGITAVLAALVFILLSRLFFKRDLATTTLTATCSGYVNSNNIGIPVSMYVIGEITYVPPLIILQVVVFTPLILSILEAARGSNRGVALAFARASRNPIIIGTMLGLLVSLFDLEMPEIVMAPLDMLGAAAIPMMLLSFGASFHGQSVFQRGSGLKEAFTATLIKVLLMPLIAWIIAGPVWGLAAHEVFAATVIAALPTAQNIYNFAATYRRGEIVVRNIVFFTTFASLPVLLLIALLLQM